MYQRWDEIFPTWEIPRQIPIVLRDVLNVSPHDDAELDFARTINAAPKIEIHVHMEAAVPTSFYSTLNLRRQLFSSESLPTHRAPFNDLNHFVSAWIDQSKLIDDESLFEDLAIAFVANRHALGIVYSEVHISPVDFTLIRQRFNICTPILDFHKALKHYLRGLKAGLRQYPGIEARLIIDVLWISTDEECRHMLTSIEALLSNGEALDELGVPLIAALGMGGPEVAERAAAKAWLTAECCRLGLKLDIHSGEHTTPDDHRLAIETLQPHRVGHGIAGAKAKPQWFFDGPITVCPTSNLITGSFIGGLAAHPVETMRSLGKLVSINSDDPLLFGVPLTLEWVALRRALGWTLRDFQDLTHQAAQSVLMPGVLARVYPKLLGAST